MLRDFDDVGEEGAFDYAVHRPRDVVDFDEGELFEDGVALALEGALEEHGAFFVVDGAVVNHALGIAVIGVEHIVGLAGDERCRFTEGVGLDVEGVREHHFGEGGGDVGDGDACKPLERDGGIGHAVLLDSVEALERGVVGVCGVEESVVAAAPVCAAHEHIRAVAVRGVGVAHDVRRLVEREGIDCLGELVDLRVLEGLQNFGAVLVDVEHFAEGEHGDLVGDIVELGN